MLPFGQLRLAATRLACASEVKPGPFIYSTLMQPLLFHRHPPQVNINPLLTWSFRKMFHLNVLSNNRINPPTNNNSNTIPLRMIPMKKCTNKFERNHGQKPCPMETGPVGTETFYSTSLKNGSVHLLPLFPLPVTDNPGIPLSIFNLYASFSLSFMKDLLPKYFSSEWSFAYCYVPSDVKFICTFGQEKNSIVVVAYDGNYYKYLFDPVRGGEATRQEYYRFLHLE